MSRLGPSVDGSLTTLVVVAAGVLTLSFAVLTGGTPQQVSLSASAPTSGTGALGAGPGAAAPAPGGAAQAPGTRTSGTGPKTGVGPATAVAPATGQAALDCAAGRNGGSTDRGVTGSTISLGATVVSSGIGASFLGPVRIGMTAVKDAVNRSGGICGRQIDLKLVDDGWDAQRGYSYIRNLVEGDQVFALAVDPSSEGLRIASNEGYFTKTRTPVIGTDGMLNSQYVDPWVWPVAASTVSTMHIMASDAYNRVRARHFSIVYDSQYHFGVEGAFAFNAAVKRLTGSDIPGSSNPGCGGRFCAISAGQQSYATENKTFNDACFNSSGQNCDFVALLLEPNEALTFMQPGFVRQFASGKGLAQTLFSRSFATACGSTCDQAVAWTGYNPPIENLAGLPAVASYVNDVRSEDQTVDIYNQFLEGGYSGMKLVVQALRQAGPTLTRDRVAAILDSQPFDDGLSTPLVWHPGQHYANVSMRPFAIQYQNGFNGFQAVGSGWVRDPWVGQDTNGNKG